MSLETYIERFQKLRVNKRGGHESPHKPSMLLAVFGLSEAGVLRENRIAFLPPLLDRYLQIFDVVRDESDQPNPYFPFFHLESDRFWHLKAVAGREAVLEAMDSARSFGAVQDNIKYAYLDAELYQYLLDPESREQLRRLLIARWFGSKAGALNRLREDDRYEKGLRARVEEGVAEELAGDYERAARDTAFRRVVTQAYDYRCAASGLRLVLPGDLVMVQAAHLIPFSEGQDDDPRNGLALTPDFHWAMDRGILAPGPDMKWHVSKLVDARIADNRILMSLDNKGLILPRDKRFWPREDALAKRILMLKS